MNRTLNLFATGAFTLALVVPAAFAQNPEPKPDDSVLKTYYLLNLTQPNDAIEVVNAVRGVVPGGTHVDLVSSQNAIIVSAPVEEQAKVQKVITDLDRPHKIYRLTFTLAESDSGKRVGIQHLSMVVVSGQRTIMKQGDKIPVATGTYDAKNDNGTQTQFQYLDIGLNLDATLVDSPGGLLLKSKVEESNLGQPSVIAGVSEPVFRQTVLEGTSGMKAGKPLTLGSLDIEGTTRHVDIEVVAEPVL